MSGEFVDTNVLLYAYDRGAGRKQSLAIELLTRLDQLSGGFISTQVLVEFYSAGTRKQRMQPAEAEDIISSFSRWNIHSPVHADLIRASRLHREHQISLWDALIVTSALEMGCTSLWTEDLQDGQKFESLTVRNPFA
jgi:predicted nucleic acid-binding protein